MHIKSVFILCAVYFARTEWGSGLSQAQIEKFINLYKVHKMECGSLDPLEIQKIFQELDMANTEHESQLLFKYNRPAAKELMDLMIITAKCRTVNKNEDRVLSPREVTICINQFNILDKNNDGLLSDEEGSYLEEQLKSALNLVERSVKGLPTYKNLKNIWTKFDFYGEKKMNVAEFLEIVLFYTKNIEDIIRLNDPNIVL